jgi:mRNA-degrading endonuclease RelE of RelBE toxin-antitoxin system
VTVQFCIADTFTDSLAKLTGEEQKAVKTTAFDLQMNPAQPSMQFHKLDKAKDPNFWSVRVSRDLRLIVHKSEVSLLLCYVDHHDEAYRWAERRKLETHPKTGAAQLVEIRETVKEVFVPTYKEVAEQVSIKPRLFDHIADDALLGYGVPAEWLEDIRQANEDSLLTLADHLPSEAAEALLELATGGKPQGRQPPARATSPFEHPDAKRRFRVMNNIEELAAALDYPWDKWAIFLHPAQRELVERDFNGPAGVAGSAGTGKTIVALHRAVHLARNNRESRVLLTTFSDTLANALRYKLRRLLHHEPRLGENIEVHSITAIGRRLYELKIGAPKIASDEEMRSLLAEVAKETPGHKFTQHFLWTEWADVVDAWQLDTWEAYRDVLRLGRKTRLPEQQRAILWSIFDRVRSRLQADGSITCAAMFGRLASELAEGKRMPSILSSLMKHKMSVSLNCDFSLRLEQVNRTASSSPGTWVNASSNNPSHGKRSASTFADARGHCTSTTGRRTRSEHRPTVCLGLNCPMSMGLLKNGSARFPYSTGRHPLYAF